MGYRKKEVNGVEKAGFKRKGKKLVVKNENRGLVCLRTEDV